MGQIIFNWLIIFIIPFVLGAFIRFSFDKKSKSWLVTVISGAVALVTTVIFIAVRSEGIGLVVVQTVCVFVGSLLMGAIIRIDRHVKKKKTSESTENNEDSIT